MSSSASIGPNYVKPTGTIGKDYPYEYTSIDDFVQSNWQISNAMKTNYNDTTRTIPKINYNFTYLDNSKVIFNTSLLRTMHSEVCIINGWYVMIGLISDKVTTTDTTKTQWNSKTSNTYVGYWYSKDGLTWTYGSSILQNAALTNPIVWDCSFVMREGTENTIDIFFTSVISDQSYMEIYHSSGTIIANNNGVAIDGFSSSELMLDTDGILYSSQEQNTNFVFSAPYPFINPGDGNVYCLFEARLPGMITSYVITEKESGVIPPGRVVGTNAADGNSCIGIAKFTGDYDSGNFSSSNWTLMTPIISCLGVTTEFSRPQILFNGPYTYITGSVDSGSFTGGLYSPAGLYGFLSRTGLFGSYEPMNGSGFIIGNPTSSPEQSTSFFIDNNFNVYSSVEVLPKDGPQDPNNPKTFRIGGTPAPTVNLKVNEDETFITGVKNFGQAVITLDWNTIYTTYGGNSAPWVRSNA